VKPKGFTGGLTFGYNAQAGNHVYGFEMDANTFGLTGDRSSTVVYQSAPTTTFTIHERTKGGYLLTLRGRVGYAAGRNLWYGTGGLALATLKIEDTFSDTYASAAESVSQSKSKVGWTLGGGYEFAMQNRWSFKAELLYASFGKVTSNGGVLTTSAPPASYPEHVFTHSADLKSEILRFGFNYRF
jgi:outer membrane immunogenic protein